MELIVNWYWTIAITIMSVLSFLAGWHEHREMIEKITNSRTYKIKAPEISEHALYFTIVGLEKPIAFFLNSKDMKSFMTAYSRQLRCGVAVENIIKDMKSAFDPAGEYIIPDGSGRKVNSITHHFGIILEEHISTLQKEISNAKR